MFLEMDGSSGDFGFEVPTGDPGLISMAGDAFTSLGDELATQQSVIASAKAAHRSGNAASAYAEAVDEMVRYVGSNADASRSAASALHELAHALKTAQSAATDALNECEQASQEQETHAAAAAAESRQGDTEHAANRAAQQLSDARQRGQDAVQSYEAGARATSAKLHEAEGDLRVITSRGAVAMSAVAFQLAPILAKAEAASTEELAEMAAAVESDGAPGAEKAADAVVADLESEAKESIPADAPGETGEAASALEEAEQGSEDTGEDADKLSDALKGSGALIDVAGKALQTAQVLGDILTGHGSLEDRAEESIDGAKDWVIGDISADAAETARNLSLTLGASFD